MNINRIAPCPTAWCKHDDPPHTWQDCADEWVVSCPSCGVNGPGHPTEAEAITAWSTRTDPDHIAAIREAVAAFRWLANYPGVRAHVGSKAYDPAIAAIRSLDTLLQTKGDDRGEG